MERSETKIRTASDRQGGDKYPGIDTYEYTTLRKGTRICALVAYNEEGKMKPCEFYFPQKVLQQVGNNPIKLSQGLQISPWKNPKTGVYCYRTRVATFVVTRDFETEYSAKVEENLCYGNGGFIQYHISKETADQYLIKEPEDIFLPDGQISEEEYEEIMEKHQQILIKRNLFSYLKAKADTLDILQNASDPQEIEEAKKNLRTLNRHIEDLTIDLAYSQENIGDIKSGKYDRLISQLVIETECREEENVLVISNAKLGKEMEEMSQKIGQNTSYVLVSSDPQNEAGALAQNITKKINSYEETISNGGKPEIDVPKQNLSDFLVINHINNHCRKLLENIQPQDRTFQSIDTILIQSQNGQHQRIPIDNLFEPDSVSAIRATRNGTFSAPLHIKGNDQTAKLLMRGNKPRMYLAQTDEQLNQTFDRLHLTTSQREALHKGGKINLRQGAFRLDKEINCLVPCLSNIKGEQQNTIKRRGPNIQQRGHSY
ncbi:MAG: hypothetical protein IKN77_02385 [Paludibacteraceae bacterium]|nr:hypothetical protein [Paludibacteraceae bacterium]